MKLVDKDEIMKFPVRLDNYDETNGRRQYVLGIEAVLGYIHEMPTIDAIPIEWIKYHVMSRKDLTFDKLGFIWGIIKDWEKENEMR